MHDIRPYLPELFSSPGTLLYIGARVDAHSWLEELAEAGNQITILEVWQDNFDKLVKADDLGWTHVVHGDVRNIDSMSPFDYIFWWHGPEHLKQSEIADVVQALESKANKLVAMACPYGNYPQGAHAGNPYEVHMSSIYPNYFEWLGYETATDGEADKAGSEIVAWKRM